MKKFILVLMILLFAVSVQAKEIQLTFAWDANSEAAMAGYAIFQRTEGQAYNYNFPIDPNCTKGTDGKCYIDPVAKTCEFTPPAFNAPEGVITVFCWVARAKDIHGNWSANSNEVCYTVDLAPIVAPAISTGIYDEPNNLINIAFSQTDYLRVAKWELYMANKSGGPYTKVDTITRDSESDFSAAWQVTTEGIYYFVLVSFTSEGVFSQNSNEMFVEVRKSPSPVHDFRIKIRVQ